MEIQENLDDPTTVSSPVTEEDNGAADAQQSESKSEENIPFHKHPRWQEVLNERREQAKKIEDLETQLSGVKPIVEQYQKEHAPQEEIPYWFNGDAKQWKAFNDDYLGKRIVEAEERALQKFEEKISMQRRQEQEATQFIENSLSELEKEFGEFDRNKVLKVALDNDLLDSKGRYNLKAAYFVAKASDNTQSVPKNTAPKKQVISTGYDKTTEPRTRDYRVPSDFRINRPW